MKLSYNKEAVFRTVLLLVTGISCALLMNSYKLKYEQREVFDVARSDYESPIDVMSEDGSYIVRRGEVIFRSGKILSETEVDKLRLIESSLTSTHHLRTFAGSVVLCMSVFFILYFFASSRWREFNPSSGDMLLFALCMVAGFGLLQLFQAVGQSLSFSYPWLKPEVFKLMAPLAAAGMLIQVTIGTLGVLLYAVSFSLLGATYLESGWLLPAVVLLGNILGSVLVADAHKRSSFLTSGFWIGIANATLCIAYCLIYPEKTLPEMSTLCLFAFGGGLFSGVLALGLTPVAELVGSYVTDIKLLELASMDRELLRDLSLQAPGTWNHSVLVGQLGEAGADRIGANGALLRVAAYYHDIGKMKKPLYFTENQFGEENKHEKLTPSMSALIIRAHVKDGVEMAKQHRLPSVIIDLIKQHHGTSLIEYFYDRAMKEASEEEAVKEENYRYPGPKPQTREAGILMLADSIEAACRSMNNPSPAKIQGLVQKMINKVFSSGELDESGLTLRDLHLLTKEFVRVLSSVHHRRVSYPDEQEPEPKVTKLDVDESRSNKQNKDSNGSGDKDSKSGRSNIHRLGLKQ